MVTQTNVILAVLCAVDLVNVITTIVRVMNDRILDSVPEPPEVPKYVHLYRAVIVWLDIQTDVTASAASIWLHVLLAYWRCRVIAKPLSPLSWDTIHNARRACFGTVVAVILSLTPVYFTIGITSDEKEIPETGMRQVYYVSRS
jgi:hypothetical protein